MLTVDQRYRFVYKPLLWIACLAPLATIVAAAAGLTDASLGADPIRASIHRLGNTALNLLLITLCITPLRELLGRPQLLRLRRLLGLFAFAYAALHFLAYAGLDLQFDLGAVGSEIAKRPYILVGLTALLGLLPLAMTSTRRAMRRLGRRWTSLHRLVYPIAVLAVWHLTWQTKADFVEPLLYSLALALLLGYRLRRWRIRSTSVPATAPERT